MTERIRSIAKNHREYDWSKQKYLLAKSALVRRRRELLIARAIGGPTDGLERMITHLEKAKSVHYKAFATDRK